VLGNSGNFLGCMHHLAAWGLPPSANAKMMTLRGCGGAGLGLERSFEVSFYLFECRGEIGWLWH